MLHFFAINAIVHTYNEANKYHKAMTGHLEPVGEGDSQIWIGRGCAAGSSGSMFGGNFPKKMYSCLGIFMKKGTHF